MWLNVVKQETAMGRFMAVQYTAEIVESLAKFRMELLSAGNGTLVDLREFSNDPKEYFKSLEVEFYSYDRVLDLYWAGKEIENVC